jgi:phage baseplate assembly protein W
MTDIRRIDKITKTDAAGKKPAHYSDFYNNLDMHPQNKTVASYTDEAAVKRSIRNILSTDYGERMFNPKFGANLRRYLFEDMSPFTATLIKDAIKDAVDKLEPRARVTNVLVLPNEINNSYEVSVFFEVINSVNPQNITLTLYRVR